MAARGGRRGASIDDIDAVRDVGARAHYEDAAYYDLAYAERRKDVRFYVALAKRLGGPVLEYGVGSGRVALPIARAGLSVTGVDASLPMLARLKARLDKEPARVRERVRVVHGDMRELALRKRFPLVIAPFNAVLHLYERRDVEAFLARVRAHLAPGGRFVFDFSVPQPGDLDRDPNQRYRAPRFRHPETGELLRYTERFEYHPLRQLLVIWMEFEPKAGGESWSIPLSHRQFFPQEIEALLHYNGFADIEFGGDFKDGPARGDADSLVVSCRAGR